jgi:hypothetical protein
MKDNVSCQWSVVRCKKQAHSSRLTGKMLISQIVNSSNGQMVETVEVPEAVETIQPL